ncbi:aspartate/glutamate racemase family protein [Leifsonia sp. F6_8S_P_1B]|uniref:Aspartate/glutamate racemase family protein n=1 Tax=Leifsonia williamsii TaxID=3035919 RepID=A0ABT8K8J5_9MICO|nr:aspartate/glutamate racemase family protein [Leifsonia williamsii]MDN4613357.1 aspartate/glutamate racemase family protein [Leifsonia williamsii]
MPTVGLLHTVPALAATFDGMLAAASGSSGLSGLSGLSGSRLDREHVVDAWMLETAIREGVTPEVEARVASHLHHLAASGADAVLVTCSSIGEAAEAAALGLDIPVVRVDAAMAAEAVRLAGGLPAPHIAVLATNTATLGPTTRLLEREVAAQGSSATVAATVVEGAASARGAGDQQTHDRLIADAVRAADASVIVLAQASMAAAAEGAGVDVPVLTSPEGGVARLLESLTPPGPAAPADRANRSTPPGPGGPPPASLGGALPTTPAPAPTTTSTHPSDLAQHAVSDLPPHGDHP